MFEDHGIRFYINSREGKRHNEPHVHVDIRQGEGSGSFSLKTAEQLTGSKIRKKDQKIIKEIIENMYKSSFFENVDLLNSEKEETKYQHW